MAIPKFVLVMAVVATFLVPGCAAPNQATYSCTPEAGGEPYACVKEQYDLMVERNKLYAEAEAVYRKFLTEDNQIRRQGGADSATSVLLETTTGKYLADSLKGYRELKARNGRFIGESKLAPFRRAPGDSQAGSIVALKVCIDDRAVQAVDDGEKAGFGDVYEETGYFVRESDSLKLTTYGFTVVSTC